MLGYLYLQNHDKKCAIYHDFFKKDLFEMSDAKSLYVKEVEPRMVEAIIYKSETRFRRMESRVQIFS